MNPFGLESLSIRGGAIPFRDNSEVEDCNDAGIISSSFAIKRRQMLNENSQERGIQCEQLQFGKGNKWVSGNQIKYAQNWLRGEMSHQTKAKAP